MADPAQRRAFMLDMLSGEIDLDKDQRVKMKAVLDSAAAEAEPIQDQVERSRIELQAAAKAGKPKSDVDKIAKQIGALEERMAGVEVKLYIAALAVLKPEQRPNADSLLPMLSMMLQMEGLSSAKTQCGSRQQCSRCPFQSVLVM